MDLARLIDVTPYKLRRKVATAVNRHVGVELAAELLGHTDPKITIRLGSAEDDSEE